MPLLFLKYSGKPFVCFSSIFFVACEGILHCCADVTWVLSSEEVLLEPRPELEWTVDTARIRTPLIALPEPPAAFFGEIDRDTLLQGKIKQTKWRAHGAPGSLGRLPRSSNRQATYFEGLEEQRIVTQDKEISGDCIRVMFLKSDRTLGIWPQTLAENHGCGWVVSAGGPWGDQVGGRGGLSFELCAAEGGDRGWGRGLSLPAPPWPHLCASHLRGGAAPNGRSWSSLEKKCSLASSYANTSGP